jgi:hypothetical protein
MQALKESLRKMCVYSSSALANMQYDCNCLAKTFEAINPAKDVAAFAQANYRLAPPDPSPRDVSSQAALSLSRTPPESPSRTSEHPSEHPSRSLGAVSSPVSPSKRPLAPEPNAMPSMAELRAATVASFMHRLLDKAVDKSDDTAVDKSTKNRTEGKRGVIRSEE